MAGQNILTFESMGLTLPYSMEAEQAVLGALIVESSLFSQIAGMLDAQAFYYAQNRDIFKQISRLYTESGAVDFVTLLDAVQQAEIFQSDEEAKVYITQLAEWVPTLSNIEHYAKIVVERYRVRALMEAARKILQSTHEQQDADLLLEHAEQQIYQIRAGKTNQSLTAISDVIIDALSHLQEIGGPNRNQFLGIPTGFTYLDAMLTGLGRSDLIILAARPGMGKTSFALNILTNVAKREKLGVAMFSLEMTKDQLVNRILSSEAAIQSQAFRTGTLSVENWTDLARASEVLAKTNIYLDDTSQITVAEMKAKIQRINQDPNKGKIDLVIIDYLQLMSSGRRNENRVQEISEITRNLKIMAKDLNVPIIALSQLSRSTEKNRADHRPMLSDLRDSGSIEQDADSVLFLYREEYYNRDSEQEETHGMSRAECIVAKNRHGETGVAELMWDGAHTRFTNMDYRHARDFS